MVSTFLGSFCVSTSEKKKENLFTLGSTVNLFQDCFHKQLRYLTYCIHIKDGNIKLLYTRRV